MSQPLSLTKGSDCMAILTESKIKKLLKTTDLKETKYLVLEPGTIITPSARGYLNGISIHYEEAVPVTHQTEEPDLPIQVLPKTEYKENRISKKWRLEVDKLLNVTVQKQYEAYRQQKNEQVAELAVIVTILKDLRNLDVESAYTIAESFGSTVTEVQEQYPQMTFIPTYTAGEWALYFYDCVVQLRVLEVQADIQLRDYLLDTEFQKLNDHLRLLIDYAWLLMVKQHETKSKGGEDAHAIG